MARISGESMWLVFSIILIIIVMLIVFALLAGLSPGSIFDLFQGIMSGIAVYLLAQLHAILR